MTNEKKTNVFKWIAVSLGIVILLLSWFLFQSSQSENKHSEGERQANARAAKYQQQAARSDSSVSYLKNYIRLDRKIMDTLSQQLETVKKELSVSKGRNVSLADQVRAAKLVKDTTGYVVACDSLVEENSSLLFLINDYQRVTDSLMGKMALNGLRSDSIASEKERLNSILRESFMKTDSAYNSLYKDYTKSVKKIKVERVKTKVAAGLGIAAVILTLFLK